MATQDFSMIAGDTKVLTVTVRDPSTGDPVSIVDASITWKASKSVGRTVVLTKTTAAGISITDGANGVFTITLAAANTVGFSGSYIHEAKVTFSDGTVQRVLRGMMHVEPALT